MSALYSCLSFVLVVHWLKYSLHHPIKKRTNNCINLLIFVKEKKVDTGLTGMQLEVFFLSKLSPNFVEMNTK